MRKDREIFEAIVNNGYVMQIKCSSGEYLYHGKNIEEAMYTLRCVDEAYIYVLQKHEDDPDRWTYIVNGKKVSSIGWIYWINGMHHDYHTENVSDYSISLDDKINLSEVVWENNLKEINNV